MDFETFNEILWAARQLEKQIVQIEKAFDVQLCDGLLIETQHRLLELLVDKCEPETEEDSIILKYAFEDDWGRKSRTYTLRGITYNIFNSKDLYNYLMALNNTSRYDEKE